MTKTKLSSVVTRAVAFVALVTLAAGCGGDDDDITGNIGNTGVGSFDVSLTGGSAGTYHGVASAVSANGGFTIGLTTTDAKFALLITRFGTRPGVGTDPISAPSATGFSSTITINAGQTVYATSSGTLTITSSSASEIKGSFTMTSSAAVGGGATTSASGTFTAVCVAGGC